MKILVIGETPAINSGFANVLRELNAHWISEGHEIRQLGWCHMKDMPNTYPYQIYPVKSPIGYEDYFGVNIFDDIIDEYKPDVVFSLGDVYMLTWVPNARTRHKFKWILYTPIDSAPIPTTWYHTLINAEMLITYSKFGYQSLLDTGVDFHIPPKMIYHGYNPNIFYKMPNAEVLKVKEDNKLTGKFVLGFVGTNSTRKHPPEMLEAWSKFKENKDDVVLLMHTKPNDDRQGFDLREVMHQFKLLESDTMFIAGANPIGGVPTDSMNKLYNMMDINVTSASCEGFGLPLLEAAACGTPSIGVNYSSIPELIEGHGELVKPKVFYYHRPLCQRRPLIDIDDFVEKMEKLYYDKDLLKEYSIKGIEFARQFVWENFFPEFDKALEEIVNVPSIEKVRQVRNTCYVEV